MTDKLGWTERDAEAWPDALELIAWARGMVRSGCDKQYDGRSYFAAIADSIERRDEAFLKLAGENKNRRHANEKLEQELAASRAENAALAKLVDELIGWHDAMAHSDYETHEDAHRAIAVRFQALRAPQTGVAE